MPIKASAICAHHALCIMQEFVVPLIVPWLPPRKPPADPRPRPEPGEVPSEAPPMALALPMFAVFPEDEDKAWDEDSILSWSDTPKRHGATDEATSAPCALLLTPTQTVLLRSANAMPVRHLRALTEFPSLSAGLRTEPRKPVEPEEGLASG